MINVGEKLNMAHFPSFPYLEAWVPHLQWFTKESQPSSQRSTFSHIASSCTSFFFNWDSRSWGLLLCVSTAHVQSSTNHSAQLQFNLLDDSLGTKSSLPYLFVYVACLIYLYTYVLCIIFFPTPFPYIILFQWDYLHELDHNSTLAGMGLLVNK